MHACVRVCVCVCVCVRACACVCVCKHALICAYIIFKWKKKYIIGGGVLACGEGGGGKGLGGRGVVLEQAEGSWPKSFH